MISVPLDIHGLEARYDPGASRWTIDGGQDRHVLREWGWGERHRLIAACISAGQLDADSFVDGLLDLLVSPAPPAGLRPLYAFACLRLLGVKEDRRQMALAEAEHLFAERFGWRPADLDTQPASALDRLLQQLADTGPPSAARRYRTPDGPGWTSIVIADDPAGGSAA